MRLAVSQTIAVLADPKDHLALTTAAATPRRFMLYDMVLGSSATPAADNVFLWNISRVTAVGTGATATIAGALTSLDFGDTVASTLVANSQNATTNATVTTFVMQVPLNQRATFRWVAAPGGELMTSNAASNGYTSRAASPSPTVVATTQYYVVEL